MCTRIHLKIKDSSSSYFLESCKSVAGTRHTFLLRPINQIEVFCIGPALDNLIRHTHCSLSVDYGWIAMEIGSFSVNSISQAYEVKTASHCRHLSAI